MYQKKEIIYSETLGVCRVEEITKLTRKNGDAVMYYGLKSLMDGKSAYVPIENHSVKLRNLIDAETAENIMADAGDGFNPSERFEAEYVLTKTGGNL